MADHGKRERYLQHILEGSEPCPPCREAERAAKAAYRARRYLNRGPMLVDGTGTRRRIEALTAIGWTAALLGERLGCDRTNVSKWAQQDRVHVTTAATVRRIYDELSMTPGPSDIARSRAGRAGWQPPLAWDDDTIDDPATEPYSEAADDLVDEVAVYRAMRGDIGVQLNRAERLEAVRLLTDQGLSSAEIAGRLGKHARAVQRDRADVAARAVG